MLATRRLGRTLAARAETASTNDWAWEALSAGAPDGSAFVADAQTRGRGRDGRAWESPPGLGLLLSVALRLGCERRPASLLPLVAGLAAAEAFGRHGVPARLKWPNDLMLGGRKLAGVLCETRLLGESERPAVIGIGVNVAQRLEDFPPALRERAVSLRLAGYEVSREAAAAGFLNALEPLLADDQEGGGAGRVVARYRERADFWGRPVSVRGPAGQISGVARDLDESGGLVVRLEDGREVVAVAGDVELAESGGAG
jgi:BirA family biotin operon repressor/biotin-[acetyl-CoA-carboxylase] ligase